MYQILEHISMFEMPPVPWPGIEEFYLLLPTWLILEVDCVEYIPGIMYMGFMCFVLL